MILKSFSGPLTSNSGQNLQHHKDGVLAPSKVGLHEPYHEK